MSAIITTVLSLIQSLLPALGSAGGASLVERIVATLLQLIPVLIKEYADLLPIVKNIITALKGDESTTAAQFEVLEQLDAQVDEAFEAAAAKAEAEDASIP